MSWNQFIDEGIRALKRSDSARAEKSLKAALHYAKEHYSRTDPRLSLTLSFLGHLYFSIGDFDRAEKLLEQSVRLHDESDEATDVCLSMDKFALTEIKGHVANRAPAPLPLPTMSQVPSETDTMDGVWQQQFQTGLASMKTDEPESEELVTAYLNLESAYRLASSMFSAGDMRLIATIKALADASMKLKMFEEAESLYRRVIEQTRGTDANSVSAGQSLKLALALLYVESGNFNKAKEIFAEDDFSSLPQEAAPLKKRIEHARSLIKVYNQAEDLLAQAFAAESMGDLERASKLANNCLSQFKQGFPPNHIENARILRYRSSVLDKLEQTDQATELLQRAERIERAHLQQLEKWTRLADELPRIESNEKAAASA